MAIEVRPILDDSPDADAAWELLVTVDLASFVEDAELDELKVQRELIELDRVVLAWDGDQPVGCAAVYSLHMSIPGGALPCAGVTWVGVLPTHRRRGVMSAMLGHIHDAVRNSGKEPIAGLWASQPPIYPRFGYGLASRHLWVTVKRAHGALSSAPRDSSLRLRLVKPTEDGEFTRPVYSGVMDRRPAMTELTDNWFAGAVDDPKADREGASSLRTVIAEDDEGVRGYARYSFKHEWSQGYSDGTVNVRQLMAVDAAAEAELWRYLIDFDLSGRVDAWNLPVDSPITQWLEQPRHHKQQIGDALYLKFIDLPKAISARTFANPLDLVTDVTDDDHPQNCGRWRIAGDETGSTCTRTDDAPDLTISSTRLASTFLGSTSFNALAGAGLVKEHSKGAIQQASAAWSHYPAPWSPFVF